MSGESPTKFNISTQTGISIGLLISILIGFAWVINGQNTSKNEVRDMKNDISSDIKDLKMRIQNIEADKNSWTATDMFRWAVHLQQANADLKRLQSEGLKVPEPEIKK